MALFVMVIVTGAIFALMRDSLKTSTAALELSDAQESVRTAQEYINRDLMNTGDGLNSINNIRVPENFVRNYLTLSPVTDPATPGFINLALLTSDNNVLPNTVVRGTAPAVNVRATPLLTDRISILQTERPSYTDTGGVAPATFTPITLAANAINPATGSTAVAPADINRFAVGEIYFITSAAGAIFVTITARQGVGTRNSLFGLRRRGCVRTQQRRATQLYYRRGDPADGDLAHEDYSLLRQRQWLAHAAGLWRQERRLQRERHRGARREPAVSLLHELA